MLFLNTRIVLAQQIASLGNAWHGISGRDSTRNHCLNTWTESSRISWHGVSYGFRRLGKEGQTSTWECSWEGVPGWSRSEGRWSVSMPLAESVEGFAWLGLHTARFTAFKTRMSGLSAGLGWAGQAGHFWCLWMVPEPNTRLGGYAYLFRGDFDLGAGFLSDGWGVHTLYLDANTANKSGQEIAIRWQVLPAGGSLAWSGLKKGMNWRLALSYGQPWGTRILSNWRW